MTDNEALDMLRAQGHAAGISDRNGWVRVWIPGRNDAIDVRAGRELHELAEGKLDLRRHSRAAGSRGAGRALTSAGPIESERSRAVGLCRCSDLFIYRCY